MFSVDFPQTRHCEGWSRTVTQQPFQTRAIGAFDAQLGVQRKAATVFPACHRLGVLRVEHSTSDQLSPHTAPALGLYFVEQFQFGRRAFVKGRCSRGVGCEDTFDDDAGKVHLRIARCAKAADEGDRADPGIGARRRAGAEQGLLDDAQEDAQRQHRYRRIALQVTTQALANRQYPLAAASRGKTWSAKWAAVSTIRQDVHAGQAPRPLHNRAIRKS